MVRTAITLEQFDNKEIATINPTVINSGLVTAGAYVSQAFDVKPGTLKARVYNSDTGSHYLYLDAGGFATGINGQVSYLIPSNTTVDILINRVEAQVQQLNGSLNIDFSTGFTGLIDVSGEIGHLFATTSTYTTIGLA